MATNPKELSKSTEFIEIEEINELVKTGETRYLYGEIRCVVVQRNIGAEAYEKKSMVEHTVVIQESRETKTGLYFEPGDIKITYALHLWKNPRKSRRLTRIKLTSFF